MSIIKFGIPASVIGITSIISGQSDILIAQLMELLLIVCLFEILININKYLRILCEILFAVFNIQIFVRLWSNSYVTLVMLDNLRFLEDISSRYLEIIISLFLIILIMLLPYNVGALKIISFKKVILLLGLDIIIIAFLINPVGLTFYSSYELIGRINERNRLEQYVDNQYSDEIKGFYHERIDENIVKPDIIGNQPNVVVIFVEGMSSEIIDDQREITPNIKKWREQSISFTNYYNHTFATLKGLQGQLFSGYQINDLDCNHLISLQKVFKDYGYTTTFINTEPNNNDFSTYLENLSFDNVVSDYENQSGSLDSLSDKEAFSFLLDQMRQQNETGVPFFIAMYTFGTHATFDSIDEIYNDGNDIVLNRFYDLDTQFGWYMDELQNSELSENTIIVFTTDHASYADTDYIKAFPEYERDCTDVGEIPLFIWYKGVEAQNIDVNGRNSLCLAPTIMDLLDMNVSNYFLGSSLFLPNSSSDYEHIFYDSTYMMRTTSDSVQVLSSEERNLFYQQILPYVKGLTNEVRGGSLTAKYDEDTGNIHISFPDSNYEEVSFGIWSNIGGQDDLYWQNANLNDSVWESEVPLDYMNNNEFITIHCYGKKNGQTDLEAELSFLVQDELKTYVEMNFMSDVDQLKIDLYGGSDYDRIQFAIWGNIDDGDNLVWYDASKEADVWTLAVDVLNHVKSKDDSLKVHVYGFDKENQIHLIKQLSYDLSLEND